MNVFAPRQKIDIIVEDPGTGRRHIFYSRIEDIGRRSMTIAAPYRRGFYLPPSAGREMGVRIAADTCAYLYKATLLSHNVDPVPVWVITPPADVKKIQMRSHVRIRAVLDVTLELVEEKGGVIATLTRDISAGGLKVALLRPLVAGTRVKVIINLPGMGVVEALGEVIRDIPPEEPGERRTAAVKFTDIRERDRGEIVKFIFKKQVERRKKELELFE
jgi:c-di-GMP-binding flagellar brake protein YcgR